jgi:hypothetical protein
MPLRSSTGTLKGATPTASDDLTTKAYVDPLIRPTELGTGVDLNTIITPGIYSQTSSVEAQAGTNYPPSAAAAQAGLLEVFVTVATPIMYWQRYMPYLSFTKTMYVRGWYNNAWSVWSAFSADNALDGGWVTIKTVDPILRIRQVGNTIWLYQDGALDTAAGGLVNNGSKVFAGLIPTAMRPSSNVRLSCALDQRPGVVIAGSNGDVTYFNYTGATRTNVNASQSNYILG